MIVPQHPSHVIARSEATTPRTDRGITRSPAWRGISSIAFKRLWPGDGFAALAMTLKQSVFARGEVTTLRKKRGIARFPTFPTCHREERSDDAPHRSRDYTISRVERNFIHGIQAIVAGRWLRCARNDTEAIYFSEARSDNMIDFVKILLQDHVAVELVAIATS
jgi:hypothetical protein